MKLAEEELGTALIIEVQVKPRPLIKGIAKQLAGTRSYSVWIPGCCNIIVEPDGFGQWQVIAGRKVIPELLEVIGRFLEV